MSKLKLSLYKNTSLSVSGMALASALVLASAQSGAYAQTAAAPATVAPAPADAGDIVVTGYARSLQNANTIKKLSVSVIESISAEDVGKLPDVSIADALSRLPGLAVQQESGRAKYLSIRGFGPDYTTASLNGRFLASVDEGRRFDYSLFPGDIFQEIDVIKTPSANLINPGLAGTVNLQTFDPLKSKRVVAINLEGTMGQYSALNPEASNKGYKATFVYIDKFNDGKLGVSLGLSASNDPEQSYHFGTGGANGNYNTPDGFGNIGPSDLQNYANSNTLTRQTAFGHIVYKPDQKFEMSVDGLYSQSKVREYSRGWEFPLAGWSHDSLVPGSEQASGGYVTSAQWTANPVLRNDFNTSDDKLYGFGWNMKYSLSKSTKLNLDANYSHAQSHKNTYEIYMGTSWQNISATPPIGTVTRQADGSYGVSISGGNFASPTSVFLTDPQGWGQVGFNNIPDNSDEVKGFRASLENDMHFGFFHGIELGVNYSDETKTDSFSAYFICLPGAAGTVTTGGCGNWPGLNGGANAVAIPSSIVKGSVSPYGVTGTNILAVDAIAAQGLLRTAPTSTSYNSARDWTVEEKLLTGYIQANIKANGVRGNIGAQIVNTNQSSIGNISATATTTKPVSTSTSYTYFLPSMNLNFTLAQNMFMRLGASRTLARAQLSEENASFSVNSCGVSAGKALGCTGVPLIGGLQPVLNGNGGNPYLRPYFSNNLDVSFENYFAKDQGKIAIAAYYKDISNFTTTNSNLINTINNNGPSSSTTYATDFTAFAGYLNGATISAAQTYQGYASAPTNDGGGYVLGVEGSVVLPLKAVSPSLDGLGVSGNLALNDSSIKFSNGAAITLPGLSNTIYQGVIWYEKYGFNARMSYTHRSQYLGDYNLYNAQVTANLTKAQNTLDAQIGYDFKSGMMKGLSLYLQGHNLTNAKTISYVNNDPNQVNIRDQYGANYHLGFTFKF